MNVIAGLLVAVMASALVQEAPHEYLGAALFVAVAAHAILNRRQLKALLRGRRNAVRILLHKSMIVVPGVKVHGLAKRIMGDKGSNQSGGAPIHHLLESAKATVTVHNAFVKRSL